MTFDKRLRNNTQTYKGYSITSTSISDPDGSLHWMTYNKMSTTKEEIYENAVEIIDEYLKEKE